MINLLRQLIPSLASVGTCCLFLTAVTGASGQSAPPAPKKTLDYEFFKDKVQPIFLNHRLTGYARCYACHEKTRHKGFGFVLEKLEPGKDNWTEEQSRKNFQSTLRLVVPGNVPMSVLLIHPLAPESGGDAVRIHSGGRQFPSMEDPDFQTLAKWVKGVTQTVSSSDGAAPAATETVEKVAKDRDDGRLTFEQCELCHNIHGPEVKIGPSLQGIFKKQKLMNGKPVTEQNVRDFIKSGGMAMPAFSSLSDQELNVIINYMKTL